MSEYHEPVLTSEVIESLQVTKGKRYIDATVGGGGHSLEIVRRGGNVLGIDADSAAERETQRFLTSELQKSADMGSWHIIKGNFRDIEHIAKERGFTKVDGILFDLGVSSHQIDTPGRGFSYRAADVAFDMRMDAGHGVPAYTLIQTLSEKELYEILTRYGEEEHAGAIAHAIVRTRSLTPLITVSDVLRVLEVALGKKVQPDTKSRVFQAFRIKVNDELEALRHGLFGAKKVLRESGRLAVISFHSLEDRIVKQYLDTDGWAKVTKKPIRASPQETALNPRARSAKLRVATRVFVTQA